MEPNILYLHQKIIIYRSHTLCPYEIINHTGEEAVIKGFKKIGRKEMMPIVEFNNKRRMWILSEEINNIDSKLDKNRKN